MLSCILIGDKHKVTSKIMIDHYRLYNSNRSVSKQLEWQLPVYIKFFTVSQE